ncbi:MAG: serine/threonine protein kinase [Deltaproteobacteria bacterium]|nr:serine/threonine protein kinase [Deltaproteobacteria bacterium]
MQQAPLGSCPGCRGEGRVGTPCPEPACAAAGLHRIHPEHAIRVVPSSRPPLVGRRIDDMLVLERIGSGATGTVYLAAKPDTGVRLALKVVVPSTDVRQKSPGSVGAEARALAAVRHPNVVALHAVGTFEGATWLAMDLVEDGYPLDMVIERRTAMGSSFLDAEVRGIVDQAADGLEAAHRCGVVHRDVKPANLLVEFRGEGRTQVWVVDFGLAKDVTRVSSTSTIVGTAAYIAPEQLRGRDIGPWTDLYGLAVVAYELIDLSLPFPGNGYPEVFSRKLDIGFDPGEALRRKGYPDGVAAFFRKALGRLPERRFRDAGEFRAAFDMVMSLLAGRRPPSGRTAVSSPPETPPTPTPDETITARRRAALRAWIGRERARLEGPGPCGTG